MKKLPLILVTIYLFLVAISIIPIFTDKEALSGVFAVMLTLPWSGILGNLIPSPSAFSGLVVIVVSALINALIIGAIARWVVNR
jgi:hypothetical protein